MRQLRFVGPGHDRDHVILETGDGDEQFVLFVDDAMRDAVRADLPRLHPEPEPASALSPREIQTRVRAGNSPKELADAYEIPLERVLRFAGPVLDERQRVASEARRGKARRSTSDAQSVVFGEAVDTRFAAHGIDPSDVTWDARRRPDGQWIITAHWVGGDAERSADWVFSLVTRSVTPMDDTAADLLSDRPIRPVVVPDPEPERPSLAAAPPLAAGVVAFPVMDTRTDELPAVDRDHPGQRTARAQAELDTEAFDRLAGLEGLDEDPRGVADFDERGVHAPPLPLRLADPAPAPVAKVRNLGIAHRDDDAPSAGSTDATDATDDANWAAHEQGRFADAGELPGAEFPHDQFPDADTDGDPAGFGGWVDDDPPAESPEERAARARIPSWDDILLGVRRKND